MRIRRRARGYVMAAVLVLAVFGAGFGSVARAQVVFDRVVALINGELVTKSDLLWNLALDPSVPPSDFWKEDLQELTLRTVIDQRLLLQEASKLPATNVTREEIDQYVAALAARFSQADDPTRFERRLELVGLTRERLRSIVRNRIQIEKFVDFRFRSFVVVSESDIRSYYETVEKPRLREQGVVPPEQPTPEIRDAIEEVLANEKVVDAIDDYLEEARSRAEVVRYEDAVVRNQ